MQPAWLSVLMVFLSTGLASGQVIIWNEAVQGDLSNNQAAPNQFTLGLGTSSIIASVAGEGDLRDFYTLTVPSGRALRSMVLASYASIDSTSFVGVQQGTSFTGSVEDAANYLGYAHFGPLVLGDNLLPTMGIAPGAQGFTPPLPAGSYTFVTQQLGSIADYRFDITVASVPEPATWPLLGLSVGCCAAASVYRRRQLSREADLPMLQ